MRRLVLGLFTGSILLVGCGQEDLGSEFHIRNMSPAEISADFQQMVNAVSDFYGPLQYKEARFGFQWQDLVAQTRQELVAAKDDAEVFGIYAGFLATLQDGHVGIRFPTTNGAVGSYVIDMTIAPFQQAESKEFRAHVSKIGDAFKDSGVELWDELVSVDGTPTMDYLPIIRRYQTFGYEGSDRHFIYRVLNRPSYMTKLKPVSNRAKLVFRKSNGRELTIDAVWEIKKPIDVSYVDQGLVAARALELNEVAQGTLNEMGAVKPFFISDAVTKALDIQPVIANRSMLEKYGFKPEDKVPEIFAGLYRHNGKTVFLIRNRGYHHDKATEGFSNEDYMQHYRALLDQYDSVADVLVVDQTHNGGGSYCESFFTLFIQDEKKGFVQANNADRRWIRTLEAWAKSGLFGSMPVSSELSQSYLENARQVERAIDEGRKMTDPLPIIAFNMSRPDAGYQWKKPVLVLINELAGSCADVFPMLVQRNQAGQLFGHRTMGLGGNVEPVAELNTSGASVRVTRGLFTTYEPSGLYLTENFVENNGVHPEIAHEVTIEDARQGFVDYTRAFSDAAVKLVP